MAAQSEQDKVLRRVEEEKIGLVKFQWLGNDLIPRAMVSHADFLREHMRDGIGIPMALQSFNVLDKLAYGGSWGSESPELKIVPDPTTYSTLPYAPGTGRMIGELCGLDLKPHPTDGRHFLRGIIAQAEEMGYSPAASCETEFYVLRNDAGKIIPYVDTKFATSHSYDLYSTYVQELVSNLSVMGVRLERLKKEYGHAQIEPIFRYMGALAAADSVIALKDVAKGVAAKHGAFASFMPKPYSDLPGSGCHIHLSLFDLKTKRNVFAETNDKRGCNMSQLGYQFIGGALKHMNGISIFGAPLSNSYKRLLPGSWAPAHVCYGYDHRGAAIRIPSIPPHSDGTGQRIEWRLPDPSCNPYYAVGTLLAAGLDGIAKKIDPGEPMREDPAQLSDQELERREIAWLPRTVGEAIAEAKKDPFVEETLGEVAFREYITVRESEWREYRDQVTPWEVESYLTSL